MQNSTFSKKNKGAYVDRNKKVSIIKWQLYEEDQRCFFCRNRLSEFMVEAIHLIRRSASEGLIVEKENIVIGDNACHTIFDQELSKWNDLNQERLLLALERIKEMDEYHHNRMVIKAIESGWNSPIKIEDL